MTFTTADDIRLSETEIGNGTTHLQAVLQRYCLSLTGSRWDAEDLAQDTWLGALESLRGAGHRNPEALLLRIAKNKWIDKSRRKAVLDRILQQERPETAFPGHAGSGEVEAVLQALQKHLSPLQRAVFLLRDMFGYSIGETAELLRTSEGAVKAAHHRARQALEAVKRDLRQDAAPLPEDAGLKAFLRAFAAAYELGDIAWLVELAQRDEVEPASAIAIAQSRRLSPPAVRRPAAQPMSLLAA